MFKHLKIISGGQTGADQGALFGAEASGVEMGGYAPKNFRTEIGNDYELLGLRFGLVETDSMNYLVRTELNAQNSDATLIVGRSHTAGCRATLKFCRYHEKPSKIIFYSTHCSTELNLAADIVANWLMHEFSERDELTLNVAGNRESTNPGIQDYTTKLIQLVCERTLNDVK